ncbi:MAG TPA: alpha-amylase family glycosyl hydrolase [Terriglobales bacterium]|nr:alpha-amylase family glycosyl hydrolase [Terriglobales bacterium]
MQWWQKTTIYQVYPRSFADSNGDGIGDLAGIIGKLDYIRDLGFETVWVSPFFASPQVDFGYDITDYLSVAPEYGTVEDVDRLIDEAHRRGLKVMFDLVLNHTSDQHPWFIESRASRDNPKSDWYIWAGGKGRGKPNNWRAADLVSSAWTYSAERGQYYLASFLPCQPDLNYHNPEVKQAMFDVVRFWLGKGVDGFRLDMFGSIMKDRELRSNPVNWRPRFFPGLPVPELFVQKYNLNTEESFAFARELRQVCHELGEPERILLGEVFGQPSVLQRYLGESDGLQLVFLFDFLRYRYDPAFFRDRLLAYEHDFPAPLQPTFVLSNHDRMRAASRVGGDLRKAKVLATLLLTVRGVPTVYMGDEVGMTNTPVPLAQAQDIMAKSFRRLPEPIFQGLQRAIHDTINRDEVRTPMHWDASANAGFCPPEVTPWLPVNHNKDERSVAVQQADPHSLLQLYRRLLRLRREWPALHAGDFELILDVPRPVLAYRRRSGAEVAAIYLNFGESLQHVRATADAPIVIATDERNHLHGDVLYLHPHSGVVLMQAQDAIA